MTEARTEPPIHVEPPGHTEHHAVELQDEGFFIHFGKRRVRLEYLLLAFLLLFALGLFILFLVLDLGAEQIEDFGYAGLFGLALLRSASVVIPMPAGGLTFIAGGLLDSVGGVPAPIMVALTVSIAESIGEFTGYAAGIGGARMLEDKKWYLRIKEWVRTRPFTTIFVMSMTPSPVFDFAGIAAGATRVPIRVFYPAMLGGKFIRSLIFATLGYYSVEWIEQFLL